MSIGIERVPLNLLLARNQEEHLEPVVPFAAFRDEIPVIVVAVLERTAAYHAIGDRYDTGVIRLDRCFVDPASVGWKATSVVRDSENGQPRPGQAYRNYRANGPAAEQARALSDKRALADQEAKREETTMTRGVNPRAVEERERLAAAGLKRCPRCKLEKPKDQFSATASYCRPCTALISAGRAAGRSPIKRSVKAKVPAAIRVPSGIPAETASATATMVEERVVPLLRKREALKAALAQVTAELRAMVSA